MKKSIIALATIAAMSAAHADETTLYGSAKAEYKVEATPEADGDNYDVTSGVTVKSDINLKGSDTLDNGTEAYFDLGFGNLAKDVHDEGTVLVGVKGSFGDLAMGDAGVSTDEIGEYYGQMEELNVNDEASSYSGGDDNHMVRYTSPDMSGFTVGASIVADIDNTTDENIDLYDVAAVYNANGIHAGLGYQNTLVEGDDGVVTAAAGYGNDQFEVGAKVQAALEEETVVAVGGKFNVSPMTSVYGEVGTTIVDGADTDTFNVGLGVNQKFDEKTSAYLEAGAVVVNGDETDTSDLQVAAGVKHKLSKRSKGWVKYSYTDDSEAHDVKVGMKTKF